ncbi:helix-turn-helix domain-containing protein [Haloarcula sp. Atlit-7R]|uniref:winged helix-turn-helix transcriptional regulator n=1 Tax=Haloarcula sp. Atlit-7R TaxID=2282125 RepID=UPI000EF16367|nr:helix-turn-helix domain-containing protein [Haloarcula sp. Atlit-7R]RLM95281.1 transcriptional regulator [Haloarcula sp. Atlit-7R]
MSSESRAVSWDQSSTVSRPYFADIDATFGHIHELLGRKWHLRIVYHLLEDGPLGFSDLKSRLDGVSSKMLSESLSSLEDEALVTREIVSDQPVRVEYSLTERGSALEPVVEELLRWDAEHSPAEEKR